MIMKVFCDDCKRVIGNIADEKIIPDKLVTAKCPHCGNKIILNKPVHQTHLGKGSSATAVNKQQFPRSSNSHKEAAQLEPTSAPKSQPVVAQPSKEMVLASTGQRLGNLFLDMLFYFVFAFVFGIILALIGLGDGIDRMNDHLLGLIILLIYFVPQEAFSGRTLGKLITGTKAVNEDGTKLTFGKALGRTLCRFIPFEAFSFLGGQGRPKGWHDRIPKTKVISTRKT